MIPAFISPFLNRGDLLQRMLASVDVPIERGLVVNNGPDLLMVGGGLDQEINRLGMRWFAPPFTSLGYGGTINFGITQMADAPWWFWASNDLVFHPGTLARIAEMMNGHAPPRLISGSFAWGAVNQAAVQRVGLIDEWSYYPIYFDDNDYHRRCTLGGVEWIELDGWSHGDGGHTGSLTIHSDEALRERNHHTFRENHRRYVEKWGGEIDHETLDRPWGTARLDELRPDIAGRAARLWERR